MTTNDRKFYASNAINHHPSCFPSVFYRLAIALSDFASVDPRFTGSDDAVRLKNDAQIAFDEVDWIEPEIGPETPVPAAYLNILHAYAMTLGLRDTMIDEYNPIAPIRA